MKATKPLTRDDLKDIYPRAAVPTVDQRITQLDRAMAQSIGETARRLDEMDKHLILMGREMSDRTTEIDAKLTNRTEALADMNTDTNGRLDLFAGMVQQNKDKLSELEAALAARPNLPDGVAELVAELRGLPGRLDAARRVEAAARMAKRQAAEDYELAVANALMSANGQIDGKNEETRKVQRAAYLAGHPGVKAAKSELDAVEGDLIGAELEISNVTAVESAVRNQARLVAAALQYMSGK